MSRRVNTRGGRKRRPGGLAWGVGAVAFVAALLYWEQAALLYVISTLAVSGLLLVVAFSDLKGRDVESAEATRQEKSVPAGGDELTTATVSQPKRRVARRNAGAARRLKTTTRRDGAAG